MRSAFFHFSAGPPRLRGRGADLACFALLAEVGTSADHQLVLPADFPTKTY